MAFKNDGSFMERFLQMKGQPADAVVPPPPQEPHPSAAYNTGDPNQYYAQAPPQPHGQAYGYQAYPQHQHEMHYPQNTYNMYSAGQNRMAYDVNPPSTTLWLGGTHPDTSEMELMQFFSVFGPIDHVKIVPHKNCAFVHFFDLASSSAAYANSYGAIIHGQEIRVGWGKPDARRDDRGRTSEKYQPCRNLWIGNLADSVSEDDLRREFRVFGNIERIRVLPLKNCAFINFSSISEAQDARNALNGRTLHDRQMRINFGRDDDPRPSSKPSSRREAAPPFAQPPDDASLRASINQTIDLMTRRGLNASQFTYYARLREEREGTSNVGFMYNSDHPGYAYFQWKLYCVQNNLSESQPQESHDGLPVFSSRMQEHLRSILSQLNGSKESIRAAKEWIIEQHTYARDVFKIVEEHSDSLNDSIKALFVLYLVYDVLQHCTKQRTDISILDPVCSACLSHIVPVLRAAYHGAGQEQKEKVIGILHLLSKRGTYPESTILQLEEGVRSEVETKAVSMEEDDEVPPWLRGDSNPNRDTLMDSVNEFYGDIGHG